VISVRTDDVRSPGAGNVRERRGDMGGPGTLDAAFAHQGSGLVFLFLLLRMSHQSMTVPPLSR